jgi:hypothetical protein
MMALASVFHKLLGDEPTPPESLQARLIFVHLNGTYKQVRKHLIDRKKKYNLSLTEPEALSFIIFFSQVEIEADDICERVYQTTLVSSLIGAIHKHFSGN